MDFYFNRNSKRSNAIDVDMYVDGQHNNSLSKEGILEHHQITNTKLSGEWKPWNTLIIKSPHNSIPYDKLDECVSYILE